MAPSSVPGSSRGGRARGSGGTRESPGFAGILVFIFFCPSFLGDSGWWPVWGRTEIDQPQPPSVKSGTRSDQNGQNALGARTGALETRSKPCRRRRGQVAGVCPAVPTLTEVGSAGSLRFEPLERLFEYSKALRPVWATQLPGRGANSNLSVTQFTTPLFNLLFDSDSF